MQRCLAPHQQPRGSGDAIQSRAAAAPAALGRPCRRRAPLAVTAKSRDFTREVVVGIDLGTTNSAVAWIEGGKPRCIPNAAGETITPSVVSVLKDGEVVVGRAAQRQAVLHPQTTYYSVKRLIGRPYDDPAVQDEASRLPYK
ncbi:Chaperone protein DnaK, partial [Tetrabaena socialis]